MKAAWGLGVLVACLTLVPRGAAAPELNVNPFPGTPDASPDTTIIFSALRPTDIASVRVTGSRSGAHSGALASLPDGAGTAFTPSRAFTPGERVEVTAGLRSPEAGTASGDPESKTLRFSFEVAVRGRPDPPAADTARGRPSPSETMSFHSQSFHPPRITMGTDPDTSSGDIFLTAKHAAGYSLVFDPGPMILDSQGRLVWFQPIHGVTTNLEVEHYQGQPVLTWWQTHATGGRGKKHNALGQDVIMNSSYRTVAVLHAGNGYNADSHEFQITPEGTALIDCVVPVKTNLSSVGGPSHGTALDFVIQELDIKTNRVLWEWHALGHIPVRAAYIPYRTGRPFDFFHLNSIQQLPNGNLLVSARHTWGVYEIDKHTGKLLWTLGGKYSNFKIPSSARFEWQHDAHLYPGNKLSLFDDASNGQGQKESQSSAKVLSLNIPGRRVSLLHRYVHYPPLVAPSQGSAQILPGGNMFVGWGAQPEFSEYRPNGHQVFTGSFPPGAQSYRAYRFPWHARPRTPPSVAVSPRPGGSVDIYASWNGATDVTGWRVLGGPSPDAMTALAGHARTGFETEITLQSEPRYFEVQALGSHGTVLGTSSVHSDPSHLTIFGSHAFVSSKGGAGAVAIGCFAHRSCHLSLRISWGKRVLGRGARPVPRDSGALASFNLSPGGRRALNTAAKRRLAVQMTVRELAPTPPSSRRITLIPYSVSGPAPLRSTLQSPTIQLVQSTGFVESSTGGGQILAACYAATPCRVTTTVSASGARVASTGPERLGVDELGEMRFKLDAAGRLMLRHAPGNQLPAQIALRSGGNTATGQIALVGYR